MKFPLITFLRKCAVAPFPCMAIGQFGEAGMYVIDQPRQIDEWEYLATMDVPGELQIERCVAINHRLVFKRDDVVIIGN